MLATPTRDLFAWHRALREANDPDGSAGVVLSRQAIALAFVIGTYMDKDATTPPRYAPGMNKLSSALGYRASDRRKSVTKLMRELEEAGYLIVTVRQGRNTPHLYAGAVPPASVVATEPGAAASGSGTGTGADAFPTGVGEAGEVAGATARTTVPEQGAGAAYTPPQQREAAGLRPPDCGFQAAHPSQSFTPPSRKREAGCGEYPEHAHGEPSERRATRVLIAALQQLPQADAAALSAGVRALERRTLMARRIEALCVLGAEAKVIAELAQPYDQAVNPAAVAASRVRALWVAYDRPALRPLP